MQAIRKLLFNIPLLILVMACATLGLAPFVPEPHIWEKLKMLFAGTLSNPTDIFDFLMHSTPWILLGLKLALGMQEPKQVLEK